MIEFDKDEFSLITHSLEIAIMNERKRIRISRKRPAEMWDEEEHVNFLKTLYKLWHKIDPPTLEQEEANEELFATGDF